MLFEIPSVKRQTLTFIFLNQGWPARTAWPTECGESDTLGLLGSGPKKPLWACCLRSPELLRRKPSQPEGALLRIPSWAHASSIHFKSPDSGMKPPWALKTDTSTSGIPPRYLCPCLLEQRSHPAKPCPTIWHKIMYQYEFTMCFIFKKLHTMHWKGLEIIINPVALSTQSTVLWSLNTISHFKSPGAPCLNGWSQVWAGNRQGKCRIYHPENKEATKNF